MRIHYQIKGNRNNPVILFLHGFLGSGEVWFPTVSVLEKKFCCLLVDLPGHGRSVFPESIEWGSIPKVIEALQQLLEQLQIPVCSLVGYSLGGRIALAFTISYRHLVEKLVLESSHPGLNTEAEKKARLQLDEHWANKMETQTKKEFLKDWYHQKIFKSLQAHPRFEQLLQQRHNAWGDGLAQVLRALSLGRQDSFWEALPTLHTELLLIAGRMDQKYCSIFEKVASLAPNATLSVVEAVGHNVHFEKPEAFSAMLHDFFLKPPSNLCC